MRNLSVALAAAGASFADVVKTTTFVVGYRPEQRGIIASAKEPFYKGCTPPTNALIGVIALARPEWLIDVEAIAVLD
jgi:enamine deaminase RidA (YjgF/YER057c/UK114 family)